MENFEEIEQEENISPQSSPKKKYLLIGVVLTLIIMVIMGFLLFQNSKSSITPKVFNQVVTIPKDQGRTSLSVDCSISGQLATGVIESGETNFTPKSAFDFKSSGKMLARVLSVDPFIIEILDSNLASTYIYGWIGAFKFTIDPSLTDEVAGLKMGDIISADLYGYYYASLELAAGTAIGAFEIINEGEIEYFNDIEYSLANRSGILIRYTPETTNSNQVMFIFRDGTIFYRDNNNNTFSNRVLTQDELDGLLGAFAQSNFNNIPSNHSLSAYSPGLVFVCNRYQAVPVVDNTSNLEPVLSILNEIIDTHQKQATRMLTYEKVYSIKGWEYGDIVPLGSANNIVFRKENKERLSQLKPEEKLLEEVDSLNVYYREGEKLYGVYFGSCVDGSAGTWGCFGTNEIKSEKRASRYYNIWPQDLSIKLKDISTEGIKIPSGEYLAHKDFYDSLLTWSSNLLFLEDNKLYQRLWVSLE